MTGIVIDDLRTSCRGCTIVGEFLGIASTSKRNRMKQSVKLNYLTDAKASNARYVSQMLYSTTNSLVILGISYGYSKNATHFTLGPPT